MSTPDTTHDPVVHAGMAWIAVIFAKLGIHTWSDLAAVLASFYTVLLISDWLWRKFIRTWARNKGWIKMPEPPQ